MSKSFMHLFKGRKCLVPVPTRCLQTLPTIFDESMSYYEEICKLTFTLNNMIRYLNSMVINAYYIEESQTLVFCTEGNDNIAFEYKEITETLNVYLYMEGECNPCQTFPSFR